MASLHQLQQLGNDDDSSTTSSSGSSSSSSSSSSDESPAQAPPKAKIRLKLSLRMPKASQITNKLTPKEVEVEVEEPQEVVAMEVDDDSDDGSDDDSDDDSDDHNSDQSQDGVVNATIVPTDEEDTDDDDDDDEVQTEVFEEQPPSSSTALRLSSSSPKDNKPLSTTIHSSKNNTRKSPTPLLSVRPVRLPPMTSPGLLIPPTAGVFRGGADVNGFTPPASVFDHGMSLVGYTTEARNEQPHRGSSVKRIVEDMFDSNVHFTLHFPSLVPGELWNGHAPKKMKAEETEEQVAKEQTKEQDHTGTGAGRSTLPQMLLRALSKPTSLHQKDQDAAKEENVAFTENRQRCPPLVDMLPLSLTLPYPEAYIETRVKYVEQVEARERAIVAAQEATEIAEDAKEAYEEVLAAYQPPKNNVNNPNEFDPEAPVPPPEAKTIVIPPIPEPPSPPRRSEMETNHANNSSTDGNKDEDSNHPIYIPKGREGLVAHLGSNCFHITDGRYYGLVTSSIADPHFVGPNAPGITGLTVSGGTGLATSYSGNRDSGGAGPSQAYYGGSVGGGSGATLPKPAGDGSSSKANFKKTGTTNVNGSTAASIGAEHGGSSKKDSNKIGPIPTSNAMDLKRLLEHGEKVVVEQMVTCIIRSAVHASRSGAHGGSFFGSNKEIYPDVSKAFAAHAGLRPCIRCKNNKQGAYHCRLRRKHKDIDYDGGSSWEILSPLFEEPMENLLK